MARSREELQQLLKEKGREGFILEEMKRFGFWPKDAEQPTVQEAIINRENELRQELRKLSKQHATQKNIKAQLRAMRKERMKAARQRRQETKERQEAERQARAAAWREKQANDITYLGETVSYGLSNDVANPEKLAANGLPNFKDIADLAEQMNLSVSKLRWLTFNRPVSTNSHYRKFKLPKKTGGFREISAPLPILKEAQRWVLENILYLPEVTKHAHGFVPGKSILTNAQSHVGKTLVINMDLQNFFPTVTYRRVRGFFRELGYSEKIATVLALLCTEPATDQVVADGKTYYIQTSKRALPQGAASSPQLTNLICRRLDARLSGVAKKFGLTYTRYADDLTFSGNDAAHSSVVGKLLWQVKQIIKDEGFIVHPGKTKVMRKGARREVTGIIVNEKASLLRKKLRQFRAVLHQIEQYGPEGKTWGEGPNLFPSLHGYAAYINMVRPDLGKTYLPRVEALWAKYDTGYLPPAERALARTKERLTAAVTDESPQRATVSVTSWWQRLLGWR
ncbi:MAG: reverse transcriptase family protein [Bacteroidota bacterium]